MEMKDENSTPHQNLIHKNNMSKGVTRIKSAAIVEPVPPSVPAPSSLM